MKFTKMQGAGNDFILIDNRGGEIAESEYPALAKRLCERKLSVGADAVIFILNPTHGGDYAMRFYNNDGTLGEMCGNGARCVARYGHDRGLAGNTQRIEATAGLVIGERISETRYRVRLNDPSVVMTDVSVETPQGRILCDYTELGDPGIPHAVVQMEDWDALPIDTLRELGRAIRSAAVFPKGANVTFWKTAGKNHIKVITFERGVEDFTLACGTGCGSTAAMLALRGLSGDTPVTLDCPGGVLEVSVGGLAPLPHDLLLTGPAVKVYEAELGDF